MMYMFTPQSKKQKRAKKESGWKIVVSFIIIFGLMLFAWVQEKSTAEPGVEDNHISDFLQLWKWGDALLQDGSTSGEWSFRWDVHLASSNIEVLSLIFFTDAKGELMPKNIRKNGLVINGKGSLKGSQLQLNVIKEGNNEQDAIIFLQIEQGNRNEFEQIKQYLTKIHNTLLEQDEKATFSMKVFGVANNKDSLKTLQQLSVGQLLDKYEDEGTKSNTLYTNMIHNNIWLINEKIANVQLSQHFSNFDNEKTVTIGIPLISGEFGESVPKK